MENNCKSAGVNVTKKHPAFLNIENLNGINGDEVHISSSKQYQSKPIASSTPSEIKIFKRKSKEGAKKKRFRNLYNSADEDDEEEVQILIVEEEGGVVPSEVPSLNCDTKSNSTTPNHSSLLKAMLINSSNSSSKIKVLENLIISPSQTFNNQKNNSSLSQSSNLTESTESFSSINSQMSELSNLSKSDFLGVNRSINDKVGDGGSTEFIYVLPETIPDDCLTQQSEQFLEDFIEINTPGELEPISNDQNPCLATDIGNEEIIADEEDQESPVIPLDNQESTENPKQLEIVEGECSILTYDGSLYDSDEESSQNDDSLAISKELSRADVTKIVLGEGFDACPVDDEKAVDLLQLPDELKEQYSNVGREVEVDNNVLVEESIEMVNSLKKKKVYKKRKVLTMRKWVKGKGGKRVKTPKKGANSALGRAAKLKQTNANETTENETTTNETTANEITAHEITSNKTTANKTSVNGTNAIGMVKKKLGRPRKVKTTMDKPKKEIGRPRRIQRVKKVADSSTANSETESEKTEKYFKDFGLKEVEITLNASETDRMASFYDSLNSTLSKADASEEVSKILKTKSKRIHKKESSHKHSRHRRHSRHRSSHSGSSKHSISKKHFSGRHNSRKHSSSRHGSSKHSSSLNNSSSLHNSSSRHNSLSCRHSSGRHNSSSSSHHHSNKTSSRHRKSSSNKSSRSDRDTKSTSPKILVSISLTKSPEIAKMLLNKQMKHSDQRDNDNKTERSYKDCYYYYCPDEKHECTNKVPILPPLDFETLITTNYLTKITKKQDSPEEDEENVEISEEIVETSEENVETSEENVETTEENVETSEEILETNEENVETCEKNVEISKENVEIGEETVELGEETVELDEANEEIVEENENVEDLANSSLNEDPSSDQIADSTLNTSINMNNNESPTETKENNNAAEPAGYREPNETSKVSPPEDNEDCFKDSKKELEIIEDQELEDEEQSPNFVEDLEDKKEDFEGLKDEKENSKDKKKNSKDVKEGPENFNDKQKDDITDAAPLKTDQTESAAILEETNEAACEISKSETSKLETPIKLLDTLNIIPNAIDEDVVIISSSDSSVLCISSAEECFKEDITERTSSKETEKASAIDTEKASSIEAKEASSIETEKASSIETRKTSSIENIPKTAIKGSKKLSGEETQVKCLKKRKAQRSLHGRVKNYQKKLRLSRQNETTADKDGSDLESTDVSTFSENEEQKEKIFLPTDNKTSEDSLQSSSKPSNIEPLMQNHPADESNLVNSSVEANRNEGKTKKDHFEGKDLLKLCDFIGRNFGQKMKAEIDSKYNANLETKVILNSMKLDLNSDPRISLNSGPKIGSNSGENNSETSKISESSKVSGSSKISESSTIDPAKEPNDLSGEVSELSVTDAEEENASGKRIKIKSSSSKSKRRKKTEENKDTKRRIKHVIQKIGSSEITLPPQQSLIEDENDSYSRKESQNLLLDEPKTSITFEHKETVKEQENCLTKEDSLKEPETIYCGEKLSSKENEQKPVKGIKKGKMLKPEIITKPRTLRSSNKFNVEPEPEIIEKTLFQNIPSTINDNIDDNVNKRENQELVKSVKETPDSYMKTPINKVKHQKIETVVNQTLLTFEVPISTTTLSENCFSANKNTQKECPNNSKDGQILRTTIIVANKEDLSMENENLTVKREDFTKENEDFTKENEDLKTGEKYLKATEKNLKNDEKDLTNDEKDLKNDEKDLKTVEKDQTSAKDLKFPEKKPTKKAKRFDRIKRPSERSSSRLKASKNNAPVFEEIVESQKTTVKNVEHIVDASSSPSKDSKDPLKEKQKIEEEILDFQGSNESNSSNKSAEVPKRKEESKKCVHDSLPTEESSSLKENSTKNEDSASKENSTRKEDSTVNDYCSTLGLENSSEKRSDFPEKGTSFTETSNTTLSVTVKHQLEAIFDSKIIDFQAKKSPSPKKHSKIIASPDLKCSSTTQHTKDVTNISPSRQENSPITNKKVPPESNNKSDETLNKTPSKSNKKQARKSDDSPKKVSPLKNVKLSNTSFKISLKNLVGKPKKSPKSPSKHNSSSNESDLSSSSQMSVDNSMEKNSELEKVFNENRNVAQDSNNSIDDNLAKANIAPDDGKTSKQDNDMNAAVNFKKDDEMEQLTNENRSFRVGDLVFGQLSDYPFWPCMITREPNTNQYYRSIKTYCSIHVRFFADNGRRAWVSENCIIPYKGPDTLKDHFEDLEKKEKRELNKTEARLLQRTYIKKHLRKSWEKAVEEAESMVNATVEKRHEFFSNMFAEQFKEQRKKKSERDKENRAKKRKRISIDSARTSISSKGSSSAKSETQKPAEKRRKLSSTSSHPPLVSPNIPQTETSNYILDDLNLINSDLMEQSNKPIEPQQNNMPASKSETNEDEATDKNIPNVTNKHLEKVKKQPKARQQVDQTSECNSVTDSEASSKAGMRDFGHRHKRILFKDVPRIPVCEVCLKNDGIVVKCNGKCCGFFHVQCSRLIKEEPEEGLDNDQNLDNVQKLDQKSDDNKSENAQNLGNVQIVNVRTNKKYFDRNKINLNESELLSDIPLLEKLENKLQKVMEATTGLQTHYKDSTSENSEESGVEFVSEFITNQINSNFICADCLKDSQPPCNICHQTHFYGDEQERLQCSINGCGKFYHMNCLPHWPQARKVDAKTSTFICPMHYCHTCISENPQYPHATVPLTKLVRCLKCPATFHVDSFCIPAGTQILSHIQVICPRHAEHPQGRRYTVNANWCFICSKGGDLLCCETCPTSVHQECIRINLRPDDRYICEDCESGRLPLYDEIVWAKLGSYKWWPALTLYPSDVPDNMHNIPHRAGEFVVRFFGTYDHCWIGLGKVFLFFEGDTEDKDKSKQAVYLKAVAEANELIKVKKELKKTRDLVKNRSEKPPPFQRIRVNRPVGNIKLFDGNVSSTNPCNCSPNLENPCGPSSDCLNRLLMTECDPEVCPARSSCQNQRFEKRQYAPVIPVRTPERGWGLISTSPIAKSDFVIEYVGEVIDQEEYQRRIQLMQEQKNDNFYFLTIDYTRIIDAGPKGNLARFMNHSCKPNCQTQKWTVKGDTRIGLFALEDIPACTELTFNYNLASVGEEKKECKCGADICSGFIGVKAVRDETKKARKGKAPATKSRPINLKALCFLCNKADCNLTCHHKSCSNKYHKKCVKFRGGNEATWKCGRHSCRTCHKRENLRCCYKCVECYCSAHSEGNLIRHESLGFFCKEHDPLNVVKSPRKSSSKSPSKTRKSKAPITSTPKKK